MTALVLYVLFACIALLAVSAMIHAWRTYDGRFAELRDELRVTEQGIAVRYSWHESVPARPAARVYNLRFTPTADCLPFHPPHDLPVAA
jgi:hypothetical protein